MAWAWSIGTGWPPMVKFTVQTASPVTASAVDLRCELAWKLAARGVPAMVTSCPLFSWTTVRLPSWSGVTLLSELSCFTVKGDPATLGPASLAKPRADGPSGFFGLASALAYQVPVLDWSQAELPWALDASVLAAHLETCSWSGWGKNASARPGKLAGEGGGWHTEPSGVHLGSAGAKTTAPTSVPGSL